MINEVRNAVLAFLNKNNYGYITPQDFNLYAKQAQLDIFEDMFYQYNYQVNKENIRQSGTGYADIKKGLEEDIDIFTQDVILYNSPTNLYSTTNTSNIFALPSDYYFINKVYYRPKFVIYNAINTGPVAPYRLLMGATENTTNVSIGDWVVNINSLVAGTSTAFAQVTTIFGNKEVGVSRDIFDTQPVAYSIYSNRDVVEIEKVHQNRIMRLLSSNLTAPSVEFPAYVIDGNNIMVYPLEVTTPSFYVNGLLPSNNNNNFVMCQYIRYPKDPKWTFLNITGGEPVFDQSQPDFQNFELPLDSFQDLIFRILQYSGVEVRDIDVANFATNRITEVNQEEA